ncbi:hypothetical protein CIL05_16010 [Virgibacillus profundi]|uniref:Aspartyl-phosphate phosphatase Spo0E family protein n=1 Tax=Virgibacillus profundi TaxID=2024555 RepID=A0A2A2IBJ3_9BACI|nr:aspartyl-phosphate phosphatase Spo0E family protein [Virgibacillus profundi]PAV28443.1 hypothetical protein CIL05_16010 [Virgibacillus profundi]PXY52616.1 aspartyl-phosphate phosphatase Spo0E family protein [Virgibacillus profundi]
MTTGTSLEIQIEQLRKKMYHAYENNESYDHIIKISQKLDDLLNKLDNLKKTHKLNEKSGGRLYR